MAGRPYDPNLNPSASGGGGGASRNQNLMAEMGAMSGYYNGGNAMAATLLAQSKHSARQYCVEFVVVPYIWII